MIRYDAWGDGLMDPDEFDRLGAERRASRDRGMTASTFLVAVLALALWAYIVTAVVWGIAR